MTVEEMMCGQTDHMAVSFKEESDEPFESWPTRRVELTVRDWDVTDPQARFDAAVEEWPEAATADKNQAQMWIDPDRNAAALCVYRPATETFQGMGGC